MNCSPPKPRLGLSVGIVGHRPNRLPTAQRVGVAAKVGEALALIAEAARKAHERYGAFFVEDSPALTLISALAEGADRIAAAHALEKSYSLTAILPFDSEEYARDFTSPSSIAEYEELLVRADTKLVLPGKRAQEALAYGTAGLTLVDNADILLCVWDGGESAGWGGTTDLMEHAARHGLPIIHIDARGEQETRVLWSGFASFPASSASLLELPSSDLPVLDNVVDELVRPPAGKDEGAKLSRYLGETWRSWNWRLELPMFLALLMLRPLRKTDLRPLAPATLAAEFKTPLKSQTAEPLEQTDAPSGVALSRTALAYGWADGLGIRYGQIFRGAYTSNFVCAALAVLAGVSSLVASEIFAWSNWPLAGIEVALLGFIFINTRVGRKRDWHTRWRESREVAERLRAAELLWLLALPSTAAGAREATWTAWYAGTHMRGLGLIAGALDNTRLEKIRQTLVHVAESQGAYHTRNSGLMRGIENRIELIGYILFGLAFVFAAVNLVVAVTALDLPKNWDYLFMGLTAALPALGAATFGIRLIGDFEGVADRDDRTATVLSGLVAALREEQPSLAMLRSSGRSIADAMLGDLSQWRITTETRKLVEPV